MKKRWSYTSRNTKGERGRTKRRKAVRVPRFYKMGKPIYPTVNVLIFKKRKNDSKGYSEISRVVTAP